MMLLALVLAMLLVLLARQQAAPQEPSLVGLLEVRTSALLQEHRRRLQQRVLEAFAASAGGVQR